MQATAQQLTNRGFRLVDPISQPTDRVQLWSGVAADGTGIMVWWDSSSQYVFKALGRDLDTYSIQRGLVTMAAVLADVVAAVPVNVIDANTKTALRTALRTAVTDTTV